MIKNSGEQKIQWQQEHEMLESAEEIFSDGLVSGARQKETGTTRHSSVDVDLSRVIFNLSRRLESMQLDLRKTESQLEIRTLQVETQKFRNEETIKAKSFFEKNALDLEEKVKGEVRLAKEARDAQNAAQDKIIELLAEVKQLTVSREEDREIIEGLKLDISNFQFVEIEKNNFESEAKKLEQQNKDLLLILKAKGLEGSNQKEDLARLTQHLGLLQSQIEAKDDVIKLLGTQIHEFRIQSDARESSLNVYREQIQNLEKKLENEQQLKFSLYVSAVQQIEKRLSEEEKRTILLEASARRTSSTNEKSETESLDVIRDWILKMNDAHLNSIHSKV